MIKKSTESCNLFRKVFQLNSLLALINFFLTPNPYSAFHSGRAGAGYSIVSFNFFVSPAYLIFSSVALVWLIYSRRIYINAKIIVLLSTLLLSGLASNVIFQRPITYAYDFMMILLTYILSVHERYIDNDNINWIKIGRNITILLIFGIAIALVFPNRYGYLPFEFSRTSRGEITLWKYMALQTIFPSLALIIYEKYNNKKYLIISVVMSIIILSTASRIPLVVSLLPFLYYLVIRKKRFSRIAFISLIIISMIIFWRDVLEFFTFGNELGGVENIDAILNGRFPLWSYYFEKFKDNMIWGNGVFLLERYHDYYGNAFSEVGYLKWFAEYGLIFGIVMTTFIIRASITALININNNKNHKYWDTFLSLIFLSMLPVVIQSHSRILNITDFIFWFSMFYLNSITRELISTKKINYSLNKRGEV
ncbi:O-antigen ligase family protein [Sedimentibacter sp. B4]|uniref:O-antigen ligase family protein n=1 Tax=Sedimentibacter sp. B4 TaxID=304766 RepID=UPI00030E758F|nr:O-antigen ligase family protein [Sedimentibacter sp. B4]